MRGTRLNAAQNRREDLMYEQVMRDVTKTLRGCAASRFHHLKTEETAPREEWTRGFTDLECDSLDGLRGSFGQLRAELRDEGEFRDYYTFCFGFAKEPGYGVRTLRELCP